MSDPNDTEDDPLLGSDDGLGDDIPREGRMGFVPDFVRKVAVAGLGAVFLGEEGLRSLAGQLKLPKEALGFVMGQAEKTKDEIARVISEELRRFLQSEKLRDEALKLLAGMTVEVKAQIRLVPPEERGAAAGDHAILPKVEHAELKAKSGRSKKKPEQ